LQLLNFLLIVTTALSIWRSMAIISNCESPIVVVLSESMEPAFARGDLLVLTLWDDPVRVNDITVFKLEGRDIPIVHRVVKIHEKSSDNKSYILTKGDNNPWDDRGLYNQGQNWIAKKDVVGRVAAHVPYIGMMTILMNDYPQLKFVLMGGLALFAIVTRE